MMKTNSHERALPEKGKGAPIRSAITSPGPHFIFETTSDRMTREEGEVVAVARDCVAPTKVDIVMALQGGVSVGETGRGRGT